MKQGIQASGLFITSVGMELSWRLAWAVMIMASVTYRLFPVPEAALVFISAAVVTRFVYGRGWRRVTVLGLQGVGCLFASLLLLYAFNYRSVPFFSSAWLHTLFCPPETPLEWLARVLTVCWALVFWLGGMRQARRPATHAHVCQRFDVGIGMLFGLLMIKIILIHDGIPVRDPMTAWLIVPFFLFGFTAIGQAHQDSDTAKTYITDYRIQGTLLSAVVLMLMLGGGVLTIFRPYFALAAEKGYVLFKAGAQTLGPVLVTILGFLLQGNRDRSSETTEPDNVEWGASGLDSWWMQLMGMMLWGIVGVIAIIAVAALGVGCWKFFRWLFSKTTKKEGVAAHFGRFQEWLMRLGAFLYLFWEWVGYYIRNYNTVSRIYMALLNWGKRSGLAHRQTETPLEYSLRLIHHFPVVQSELLLISDFFQREIYAEQGLNSQQFHQARSALQRLRNPALWASRIKFWFRGEIYQRRRSSRE